MLGPTVEFMSFSALKRLFIFLIRKLIYGQKLIFVDLEILARFLLTNLKS
jgi:hypothetical protein